MGTKKIINLLNNSSNEKYKFAAKKWYVIDSQTAKDKYNKTILLNLRQKVLNQVFAIILMHLFQLKET